VAQRVVQPLARAKFESKMSSYGFGKESGFGFSRTEQACDGR
jgi:hypothetical protein